MRYSQNCSWVRTESFDSPAKTQHGTTAHGLLCLMALSIIASVAPSGCIPNITLHDAISVEFSASNSPLESNFVANHRGTCSPALLNFLASRLLKRVLRTPGSIIQDIRSGSSSATSEAGRNGRGVGDVRNSEKFGSSNVTYGSFGHARRYPVHTPFQLVASLLASLLAHSHLASICKALC